MLGKGLDSETLQMILDTLRGLERDLLTSEKLLEWDEKDVLPEDVIRKMLGPDIGLHLMFLPEDDGGLGGGAHDIYCVSEAMAKIDLGIATAFLAIVLGSDPLRVGATDEQRHKWLGMIAEQGMIVAYGVTEPEAGSNVAALKTTAERIMDGDTITGYRLTGTKQFISNGTVADLYTILARTPEGPSFFVVERNTPGLQVGRMEQKHGIRSSNTAQVVLEDVEVPADQLLGLVEGKGLEQANAVFGFTRLMVAAFGLGAGVAAMERAIAYSKERKQFGKPLHELKGYAQKLLMPHVIRLEAARSYCEEVAHRIDAGEDALQTEGSIAKLFATEAGNNAAEAAIQAHGGYGYTREYMVEKIKRDVRITTIYEGTSEIQQNIIYLFRFRQIVRSKGAFYADAAREMRELGDDVAGELVATSAETLAKVLLTFNKLKINRGERVPFELANCIAEVEHAMAFCRRAHTADAPLKAACRVFAAEAATHLATAVIRLMAASPVEQDVLDAFRSELDLDRLLYTRVGSNDDMKQVVRWIVED